MSLLALIVNKIAYTIVKTAAGIKDQCCNCHANLSPAGRIIKGTMTMAQHTSAEMPKILRMVTVFDLWDSFMPLNLSGGKSTQNMRMSLQLIENIISAYRTYLRVKKTTEKNDRKKYFAFLPLVLVVMPAARAKILSHH